VQERHGLTRVSSEKGQENPPECKKKLFYCVGSQTLAHVAQRHYGVSIFGDTQNSPGCGPEQLAVVEPALSRGVGLDDL